MSSHIEIDEPSARALCWLEAIEAPDVGDHAVRRELRELEESRTDVAVTEPTEIFNVLARQFPELGENDRRLNISVPKWLIVLPVVLAFVLGIAADSLTSGGKIQLLSLPLLALLVWNLAVYGWIVFRKFRPAKESHPDNWIGEWLAQRLDQIRQLLDGEGKDDTWSALRLRFIGIWTERNRERHLNLLLAVFHGAAIAVVVGMVAGMYVRGLGFEYRAGWGSTFLSAESLYRFLVIVLGPSSAMINVPIPDPDALRELAWSVNPKGGDAAPWIHLYAETCFSYVLLPRACLAFRAWRRWSRFEWEIESNSDQEPVEIAADAKRVCVIPFNVSLDSAMRELLRSTLADESGPPNVEFREAVEYDSVRDYFADLKFQSDAPPASLAVTFSLGATPEKEIHGDVVERCQSLARRSEASVSILLEASGFLRRFGDDEERFAARLKNWTRFSEEYGLDLQVSGKGKA
jgi:hypothetical protein